MVMLGIFISRLDCFYLLLSTNKCMTDQPDEAVESASNVSWIIASTFILDVVMRVGKDYQAKVPELCRGESRFDDPFRPPNFFRIINSYDVSHTSIVQICLPCNLIDSGKMFLIYYGFARYNESDLVRS